MVEHRRDTLRLRTGAVGVYVHDLAEGHRPVVEAKGLLLRVSVPGYPTMARYDPQALAQSFTRLLEQAVEDATESAARAVDVELWVEESWAVLSISGDGAGRAQTLRIPLV